jgi:hypothetical protein
MKCKKNRLYLLSMLWLLLNLDFVDGGVSPSSDEYQIFSDGKCHNHPRLAADDPFAAVVIADKEHVVSGKAPLSLNQKENLRLQRKRQLRENRSAPRKMPPLRGKRNFSERLSSRKTGEPSLKKPIEEKKEMADPNSTLPPQSSQNTEAKKLPRLDVEGVSVPEQTTENVAAKKLPSFPIEGVPDERREKRLSKRTDVPEKESRSSSPQKPLNRKESSSAYDRYIHRKNHHPMSKNLSQNNRSTKGRTARRSSGASSKPIEQKRIEVESGALPGQPAE